MPVSTESAQGAIDVTPNDSADLPEINCRALYLGTAGTVKVTMANGSIVTFTNAAAGEHPWRVKRVWATPAPPAGIIALY